MVNVKWLDLVSALKELCHARCVARCGDIRRSNLFWKCYDECYHKCMELYAPWGAKNDEASGG